jgi:UDP-N-acetylmuramoyl-tripeptide--D-alanyl-D-alanine ligase
MPEGDALNDSEEKMLRGLLGRLERMEIKGVSTDSRNIRQGELFVALRGERFDGHDFVLDAIRNGACGALVESAVLESRYDSLGKVKNLFPVEDTLFSLQEMSAIHRKKFTVPVIGITGSNGKTTTKEMTASIMKQKGPVLKNEGNLNNHIGVPLTLLKMGPGHRSAVVEMGMSAPGEIDLLARLVKPDVGVITNIGPAHLEFLGTMDRVAAAKAELLGNMGAGGTAVLNADDRYFGVLSAQCSGKVLSFGTSPGAAVRCRDIRQGDDYTDFELIVRDAAVNVRLRALGRHNIANALAAAAAASAAGMTVEAVKYGLDEFVPVAMRSEVKVINGRTVLADCYNANPASVRAALETLVTLRPGARSVAVLGDMLELGAEGAEAHREIGRLAARLGVNAIIVVGTLSAQILEGAQEGGMPKSALFAAASHAEAAELLTRQSRVGDAVLVKGSRGMKMEKILEAF